MAGPPGTRKFGGNRFAKGGVALLTFGSQESVAVSQDGVFLISRRARSACGPSSLSASIVLTCATRGTDASFRKSWFLVRQLKLMAARQFQLTVVRQFQLTSFYYLLPDTSCSDTLRD